MYIQAGANAMTKLTTESVASIAHELDRRRLNFLRDWFKVSVLANELEDIACRQVYLFPLGVRAVTPVMYKVEWIGDETIITP